MKSSTNRLHTTLSTWAAIGFGLVFLAASTLSFPVGPVRVDLLLLPTILLYLWPRQSERYLHIWGVAIIGLLMDFVSGGPLGVWALSLMIGALLFRPSLADLKSDLVYRWTGYMTYIVVVCFVALILSWLSLSRWVPIGTLLYQLIWAIILFPVIVYIRNALRGSSGYRRT